MPDHNDAPTGESPGSEKREGVRSDRGQFGEATTFGLLDGNVAADGGTTGNSEQATETRLDGTSNLGPSPGTVSNPVSGEPNGERVTTDESVGRESQTTVFEIVTPSGDSVDYSLTTTGEITNVFASGAGGADAADGDGDGTTEIVQNDDGTWTATGYAAGGRRDSYAFEGEPVAFCPLEGTFSLYLDGTQVTVDELLDEKSSSGAESSSGVESDPIGGGGGYSDTVPRDRADYVARNRADLTSALDAAESGDTVYVPGNEEVDVAGGGFHVGDGVTLASNRGIDDAPGALLSTENSGPCFVLHGDARFTGFQLRGAGTADGTDGTDSTDGTDCSCGVEVTGSGEVDNTDIWGFSGTAVRVTSADGAQVHHNIFRDGSDSTLGHDGGTDSGNPSFANNKFEDSSQPDVIAGYVDRRTE